VVQRAASLRLLEEAYQQAHQGLYQGAARIAVRQPSCAACFPHHRGCSEETAGAYLAQLIKSGSGQEVALSCRAVSLLAITLGSDSIPVYKSVAPVLSALVASSSKPQPDRAAVSKSNSLALGC
jgi:hypothetical protein